MINKKFGKDLFLVILSNGVKLISNVLTVFVIPLIFSQQDYGFYKLFLLYVSYVGIFHFGFIDGIYLHYAGISYENLDKTTFRTFTKFLTTIEMIIAIIIIGISFVYSGDRQLILVLVGFNLIALNLTTYYQFISQVTQRFKEFAVRNIIYTFLNVVLISTFYFLQLADYKLFIILTVVINFVLLLWYVISYKDITFGRSTTFILERKNIYSMFKIGIVLLFSNLVVMFFSTIPRQFVDIMYPVELYPEVFSNFSFAYTLMGFTGVFLSAISLVLYPSLKQSTKENLKVKYNDFNSIILILVFVLISAFFPMSFIVQRLLPNYSSSLDIFFILAPGISITSAVTVIMHNYYKSLDKNKSFLIIGLINLAILTVSIYFAYTFINQNVTLIAAVTIIVQLIWYLTLDLHLNKEYKNISIKNIIFIILSSGSFYMTYYIDNLLLKFLAYCFLIIAIVSLLFWKKIRYLVSYLKNKQYKIKEQKQE